MKNIEIRSQVRQGEYENIDELAQSMAEVGLIQPILVAPLGNFRFYLVAGHRRYAAAKKLGWKTIRCMVVAQPGELERRFIQLVENLQREDLDPIDEALAYKELHDEMGLSFGEIAKKVGKSKGRIINIYKITELILKRFGAEPLTPEKISEAKEEFKGLSRSILEELAASVDKPYFEELLKAAKEGATQKKIRELREKFEKKLQEKQEGEQVSPMVVSPYAKIQHYSSAGRIDLPAFAVDLIVNDVENVMRELRKKIERILPEDLSLREIKVTIDFKKSKKNKR